MAAEEPRLWLSWSPLRECPSIRWIFIITISSHCHIVTVHSPVCASFMKSGNYLLLLLLSYLTHPATISHVHIYTFDFTPTFSPFPTQVLPYLSSWFSFCKVRVALGVLVLRGLVTTSSSARRPHVVDYTIQVCSKKCWDY